MCQVFLLNSLVDTIVGKYLSDLCSSLESTPDVDEINRNKLIMENKIKVLLNEELSGKYLINFDEKEQENLIIKLMKRIKEGEENE